ncbi:sensor histidine kinase [Paenibacillus mesophilus]|uniref:sensor histidine kinase n=1 Tax=Paenibacillus mesophilus TaxID=2582849 RepID=UPI0013051F5B|nr:sensor histidine kinase [Paenibacillus mesophilus]
MPAWRHALYPSQLKNRLFLSFLLLILLPFTLVSVYHFRETETLLQAKYTEQDLEQLETMKQSLENLMEVAAKTATLLEQDPAIVPVLRSPDLTDPWSRIKGVENKFNSIGNSFFLSDAPVYYTMLDFHGNVYASYSPDKPLRYGDISNEPWFLSVTGGSTAKYVWNGFEPNYVYRGHTTSPYLISLYALLKDENFIPLGAVRISIDYREWFNRIPARAASGQDYFLLNGDGRVVLQPKKSASVDPDIAAGIVSGGSGRSSYTDRGSHTLYTYSYIPSLQWYLVKKVPLDVLFRETDQLKQRFFVTILLFTALFMGMTLLIASRITRPIKLLERKMEAMVMNNLKIVLPEKGKGEILSLTRSFNRMVRDINELVHKFKMEERHKQAVRFQVLVSQMNPHFLLNTLNTIKSISLRKGDDETHEICIALGRLLENSLNTDVDLIHLKAEIGLVSAYMHIQNCRYDQQFSIRFDLDDKLQYALVPKFSLQPLVENAIYHGFGASQAKGHISIRVYSEADRLIMDICDDGIGIEKAMERKRSRARKGIGLQNLRERLELLFPGQADLQLLPLPQGAMARLYFPLLLSTPYSEGDGGAYHVDYPAR